MSSICEKISKNAHFKLANGNVKDFRIEGTKIFFKGERLAQSMIKKYKIEGAKGAYGEVYMMEIKHEGNTYNFAVKKSTRRTSFGDLVDLEDVIVLDMYPTILDCQGVLQILIIDNYSVVMELGTGDLHKLDLKKNPNVKKEILYAIGTQLLCLLDKDIYYFDIKPANILFFCRSPEKFEVALADLGSVVPDTKGYYASTYPPPTSPNGIHLPKSREETEKYYTYAMILLYISMTYDHQYIRDLSFVRPSDKYRELNERVIDAKLMSFSEDMSKGRVESHENYIINLCSTGYSKLPSLNEFLTALSKYMEI